ncbi:hypothetical protein DH2020_012949 [Rehmannia glutinosa]|uniref:BHLH domain-containing protein n=1 Tax=Rehmannia glutinosa TaxID=99300 RepID=A0ABR0X4E4_REHGL
MNKIGESSSGSKLDRKTIEKNRRIQMKGLCIKLVSLIPDDHFKPPKVILKTQEFLSQQDQLEQAADYIKLLTERIEELRKRRALMNSDATTKNDVTTEGSNLPVLKISDLNSSLEVVLISGIWKKLRLDQVISIIEEEGAQVVTVSLSNIGDKIFHTIHAQAKVARIGVDTSRISERIRKLIS